jgi:hypothetical protein
MQISKSTAYSWIAEGRLGPYLLLIKSVVRISWIDDLLVHLVSKLDKTDNTAVAPLRRKGCGSPGKAAFDMSSLG